MTQVRVPTRNKKTKMKSEKKINYRKEKNPRIVNPVIVRFGTHSPTREIFRYTETHRHNLLTVTKSSELSPNFQSPHQESVGMPAVVVSQKKDVVQNVTNYFKFYIINPSFFFHAQNTIYIETTLMA